jgi:hypothetical protein
VSAGSQSLAELRARVETARREEGERAAEQASLDEQERDLDRLAADLSPADYRAALSEIAGRRKLHDEESRRLRALRVALETRVEEAETVRRTAVAASRGGGGRAHPCRAGARGGRVRPGRVTG